MANQKLIDLSKKVKIDLAKKTKLQVRCQVALLDDISGSTGTMHKNGLMQRMFDRLFAVAYEFDDNQVLDAFAFASRAYELEPIVESMFGSYVQKYIVQNGDLSWGSTKYAPGMQKVLDHYYPMSKQVMAAAQDVMQEATVAAKGLFGKIGAMFGGKKEEVKPVPAPAPAFKPAAAAFKPAMAKVQLPDPVFCIMSTDGDNDSDDKIPTRELLEANKDKQIFWMMVGISQYGSSEFPYLKQLAQDYPNVGFYNAGEIDNVTDEMLYDKLISPKFIKWYENIKAA